MSELYVWAGQSNASGFGMNASTLPAHLQGWSSPQVQIWNASTGAFETMIAGVNTGRNGQWAGEVQFGYRWTIDPDHAGQTLFIVKEVKGSTDIFNDPAQLDWSPSSGELFATATDHIQAAKAAAGVGVSGIVWMLGEQASAEEHKALQHEALLDKQFEAFRQAWGAEDTKIIFGRVSNGTELPYKGIVRTAQESVDLRDDHAVLIDTDGFGLQADRLHFDASGHVAMGDAVCGAVSPEVDPIAHMISEIEAFLKAALPTWIFSA